LDEEQRIKQLMQIENDLRQDGYRRIAGVDEVGRGPLAGPVMAAVCVLPEKFDLPGLNDSKKLSEKKRQILQQKIQEQAVSYALGSASIEEIDRYNILAATKIAMKRALDKLKVVPDLILVDGRDRLDISLPQRPIIGGDGRCACIAAASILAKVARDAWMEDMHKIYPEYNFHLHKGYGTKNHLEAIRRFGPCAIHRQTFSPVKQYKQNRDDIKKLV